MKKGLVISVSPTRFAAVSHDADLLGAFRRAAALGYDGVELAVRDPAGLDPAALRQAAADAGLVIPAIGTGQAFVEEGLSLTDPDDQIRRAAVERLKQQLDFAAELDALVIIGLIRGRGTDNPVRDQELLETTLGEVCEAARQRGVTLVIEPINHYETRLINTLAEGMELIKKLGSADLRLLADTFHMNIEEPSIPGGIVNASPYLGHVHWADSNRRYPGAGHLPFADVHAVLEAIGYHGFVSMEMLPWPDPERAAAAAMQTVNQINHIAPGRTRGRSSGQALVAGSEISNY